jgi:6-phosphogluconolactonase (cycloisomerase 2 family)
MMVAMPGHRGRGAPLLLLGLLAVACSRDRPATGLTPADAAGITNDDPPAGHDGAADAGPAPGDTPVAAAPDARAEDAGATTPDAPATSDTAAADARDALRDTAPDRSPDSKADAGADAGPPRGHGTIYVSNGTYGLTITMLTLDPQTGVLTSWGERQGFGQNVTSMALTEDERTLWLLNYESPSGGELKTFAVDPADPRRLTEINTVRTLALLGPPRFMPGGRWLVAPGKRSIWGEFLVVPVLPDRSAGTPTLFDGSKIDLPPIGLVVPVPSGRELLAVVRPMNGPVNEVGGPVLRFIFDPDNGQLARVPGEALPGKYWGLVFHPTLARVYAGAEGKLVATTHDAQRGLVDRTEHVWNPGTAFSWKVGPLAMAPSGRFVVGFQRGSGRLLVWRLDAAGQPSPAGTAVSDAADELQERAWNHLIFDRSGRFVLVTGINKVACFELGDDGQLTARSQVVVDRPLFMAAVKGS